MTGRVQRTTRIAVALMIMVASAGMALRLSAPPGAGAVVGNALTLSSARSLGDGSIEFDATIDGFDPSTGGYAVGWERWGSAFITVSGGPQSVSNSYNICSSADEADGTCKPSAVSVTETAIPGGVTLHIDAGLDCSGPYDISVDLNYIVGQFVATTSAGDEYVYNSYLGDFWGVTLALPDGCPKRPNPSVGDVSVTEGNSGTKVVAVPVSLDVAPEAPYEMSWSTTGGTASAESDFVGASGVLSFNPSTPSATVLVSVAGDRMIEPDETFGITVTNGLVSDAGTVTIANDEPTVALAPTSIVEGDAGTTSVSMTAALSSPMPVNATLSWSTTGGTATPNADYVPASGDASFASGQTSRTFAVTVLGDVLDEYDQSIEVSVRNADGQTVATGTITILDDDASPVATAQGLSVAEGTRRVGESIYLFDYQRVQLAVSLSAPSEREIRVQCIVGPGSMVGPENGGGQYIFGVGSLRKTEARFYPGSTTATCDNELKILRDRLHEHDAVLSFSVATMSEFPERTAPVNSTPAAIVIVDDDLAPSLKVTGASVVEGTNGDTVINFKVTIGTVSGLPASFHYETRDGTAKASTGDYASVAGTEAVPAGGTFVLIPVVVHGESKYEAAESLKLVISDPVDARIVTTSGRLTGSGRILNDDVPPVVSVAAVSRAEGNLGYTTFTFTATLSEVSGLSAAFKYSTVAGSALAGSDFVGSSAAVSLPAGSLSKTFVVKVMGDVTVEPDEIFTLAFTSPARLTLASGSTQATILNDD